MQVAYISEYVGKTEDIRGPAYHYLRQGLSHGPMTLQSLCTTVLGLQKHTATLVFSVGCCRFELRDPPASASQILGLNVCAPIPSLTQLLKYKPLIPHAVLGPEPFP